MKRRVQQTVAAFVITVIVIGALCGFMVVDMSTQRYMPEDYGALLRITSIDQEGVRFSALGKGYIIAAAQFDGLKETLWRVRGFLPTSILTAGNLTARAYVAVQDYLEEPYSEDIW